MRIRNKEKARASSRKFYLAHREKVLAQNRAWAIANPEKTKAIGRKHYLANRESELAKGKLRQQAKREEINAYNRKWRAENPEKAHAYRRKWEELNPEKVREMSAGKRARRRRAEPVWVDREALEKIYASASDQGLEVDHIVPLKHPMVCGLHVPWNLQLLTRCENRSKGNRFPIERIEP